MFGGEPVKVKIAFENELVGVFIDRFGRDISINPSKRKGWSETRCNLERSAPWVDILPWNES